MRLNANPAYYLLPSMDIIGGVLLERCRDGRYVVNASRCDVWVVCACILVCIVTCFVGFWGSVFFGGSASLRECFFLHFLESAFNNMSACVVCMQKVQKAAPTSSLKRESCSEVALGRQNLLIATSPCQRPRYTSPTGPRPTSSRILMSSYGMFHSSMTLLRCCSEQQKMQAMIQRHCISKRSN